MKTLASTVGFQAPDGTLLANGSLIISLDPGLYEILAGGGQVYGTSIVINLDATAKIPGTPQIWAGDELAGHPKYSVQLCSLKNGVGSVSNALWDISGASPIDLSQMVNTSASAVSFPPPVLLNPSGDQTIAGFNLLPGTDLAQSLGNSTHRWNGSLGAVEMQSLNGLAVVMADKYASVQAAITALPATGGVVDARSPNTNLTLGALDTGSNTKIVTLLLGPYTYTFTQITVRQGFNIIGAGYLDTVLSNVGINANPAFVIPQVNNNAITIHWRDFQVLGLAGNTSQDGIFFDGSTLTNAGVELSTFENIQLTGFAGAAIHLKATQNGVSGSVGAIQGLTFINVTAIRPTGATGAAQNALRIEGGCGQINFINCWFTGNVSDTGTNVFMGTNSTQAPYSIHFDSCTNQNGFAYTIDGGNSITTENDHFEVIKGCYNLLTTTQLFAGLNFKTPFINSNVGINAGNGYIINIPNTVVNGDVTLDSPFIGSTPDNLVKNAAGNACTVRVLNARTFNSATPANVFVSSGGTGTLTPAATVDLKAWTSVQVSNSATSMTNFKSTLMPGERVTLYATGGSIQFATGGNLSLGTQNSPLVVPAGDSATFMRVDAGTPAFILVALSTKTLTGPVINGTPTGTGIPTVTFKKGTGAGNYSSPSVTDVAVDGTNLAATITIPTGWKLAILACGGITSLTAIVTTFVGIADGGTVVYTLPVSASGVGNFAPFALAWEINGDGLAHTIDLRYHTSNAADSVSINNASATQLPTMIFILTPSN